MRMLAALVAAVCLAGCTPAASPTAGPSATRSPQPSPTTPDDALVAELAGRPLRLPALGPGGACPTTGAYTGTLHPYGFYLPEDRTLHVQGTQGPDGLYEIKVVWQHVPTPTSYRGPAIVRLQRLDAPGVGRVVQYYEKEHTHGDVTLFDLNDYPRDWPAGTFVPALGCWAYQVDFRDSTEVIVVRVA